MRARKASDTKKHIKMVAYGDTGSGKTTLMLESAYLNNPDTGKPYRILFIDCEGGGAECYFESLRENGVNLENIYVVYTQSLSEVNGLVKKATNHENFYEFDDNGIEDEDKPIKDADGENFHPDMIIIDGTTVIDMTLQESLLKLSEKRARVKAEKRNLVGEEKQVAIQNSSLETRDWGKRKYLGQDFVLGLTACGLSYIISAREKPEKESKIVDGKEVSVSTGKMIPDSFKSIDYDADEVLRMIRDPKSGEYTAYIVKDRSGTYESNTYVQPNLCDYQAFLDKGKGKQEYVVKNTLNDAVKTEVAAMDKSATGGEKNDTKSVETVEDIKTLKGELSNARKPLNPSQRAKLATEFKAAGLPDSPMKVTDIAIIKKMIEITNAFAKKVSK